MSSEMTLKVLQLLRKQTEMGKTVLIASRNSQLVGYADQVIELKWIQN
jgi:ABC-type lipoprotein export system ATPase subunit